MKESMKNVFPLSFGEEVGNSVSHGVMALLLLFALPYYAIRAYLQAGALHATGISIFIICMIFMFLGSCLYHSILMNNWIGYTVLAIEWLMVIAGVLLKSISNTNHKVLSMTIYMTMGWMAIFILPALIQKCSLPFFLLILAGGILYTIGTYFYGHPQRKFNHFVWHIFIILASICHLIAILYFMI